MRSSKPVFGILALCLLALPEVTNAALGASNLAAFIQIHIFNNALIAFGGIAAAAIFYYAVRMIVDAYQEKAYTDISNSFIYVFVGFIVIAISAAFANTFGLSLYPNTTLLVPGFQSVIDFVISGSAGVFTLMVVLAGIRMITTQGDEGAFDKWRKILVGNAVGVIIMLVAYFIAHAVFDVNAGLLVEEMRGIGLFLLGVIGFTCVAALVISGILLIVSIDESLKDRAKRTIIGTLITLLIVIASYTLIITFIP